MPRRLFHIFDGWLRESPAHRQEYERALLAQLTLQWEGVPRVISDLVAKRVRLLAWVWHAVDSDPSQTMGAAPTESFIRKWLGRIAGAAPSEVTVKCEAALVPAAPMQSGRRVAP